ncbi:MAG: hypothetical protein ABI042_07390 [Verrucomicrobiota bacterium]
MRLLFFVIFCAEICQALASERIQLERTPNGGIQPQAAVGTDGELHLIYFKGEAKGGNIFYVRRSLAEQKLSEPIRVNSVSNSAVAMGTVRGAQAALGSNGHIHVLWNGNAEVHNSTHQGPPLWYARLSDAGNVFEPQRDLISRAGGLDGGSSIAADEHDNVYAMWHGSLPDNSQGEAGRAVFISRSSNGGKTFAPEQAAVTNKTGACGCCGMRAMADATGNVFALYRGASEKIDRSEILLVSGNHGETFSVANEHPWKIPACPMSTATMASSNGKTVAAWETEGKIFFAAINSKTSTLSKLQSPAGLEKQKHPSVAMNKKGEILVAWTEGTGWGRGGSLAWQIFNAEGNPTEEKGRAHGVPAWSLISCVAKGDGTFLIVY